MNYTIEYSINFNCNELVDGEKIKTYPDLCSAVKGFITVANNPDALNFSDAEKEVLSWNLHEGDYEYGENLSGQINLYCEDGRHILHAGYSRDTDRRITSCNGIELGDEPNENELRTICELGIKVE